MRMLRRFLHDRRGANAVEFALIAGPFLLILLGTVEFGRAFWYRHVIQETAIEAARCIAVPQPDCASGGAYSQATAVAHVIASAGRKGVTLTSSDVTVSRNASCFGSSGFSSVSISYEFDTALPGFLSALVGGPRMSATSCFPTQSS